MPGPSPALWPARITDTGVWAVRATPQLVTAMVFAGDLTFNPITDSLVGKDGKPWPGRMRVAELPLLTRVFCLRR